MIKVFIYIIYIYIGGGGSYTPSYYIHFIVSNDKLAILRGAVNNTITPYWMRIRGNILVIVIMPLSLKGILLDQSVCLKSIKINCALSFNKKYAESAPNISNFSFYFLILLRE